MHRCDSEVRPRGWSVACVMCHVLIEQECLLPPPYHTAHHHLPDPPLPLSLPLRNDQGTAWSKQPTTPQEAQPRGAAKRSSQERQPGAAARSGSQEWQPGGMVRAAEPCENVSQNPVAVRQNP
ncbi:hypothetical protein QJQ45_021061, partial [Haematococcus lacustris]